jgi:hypothetical protein
VESTTSSLPNDGTSFAASTVIRAPGTPSTSSIEHTGTPPSPTGRPRWPPATRRRSPDRPPRRRPGAFVHPVPAPSTPGATPAVPASGCRCGPGRVARPSCLDPRDTGSRRRPPSPVRGRPRRRPGRRAVRGRRTRRRRVSRARRRGASPRGRFNTGVGGVQPRILIPEREDDKTVCDTTVRPTGERSSRPGTTPLATRASDRSLAGG